MIRPYIRRRSLDNSYWYMGHLSSALATSADTGGSLSIFDVTIRPGMEPPAHVHSREAEAIYLFEGSLNGWAGETPLCAGAGEVANLPNHEPHGWKALPGPDGQTARGLLILVPSDLEDYFLRFSEPAQELNLPNVAENQYAAKMQQSIGQMIADAAEFGIQWMPPDYVPTLSDAPKMPRPCLSLLGEQFKPLTLAVETGGAFTALEWTSPVGSQLPRHCHEDADEAFYVLDGAIDFQTDGGFAVTAQPGDFVFLPKGLPHIHRATNGAPSCAFQILTPGGLEAAIAEAAALPPDQVTPEILAAIAARCNLTLLPE